VGKPGPAARIADYALASPSGAVTAMRSRSGRPPLVMARHGEGPDSCGDGLLAGSSFVQGFLGRVLVPVDPEPRR
jgi:hypothetical protein